MNNPKLNEFILPTGTRVNIDGLPYWCVSETVVKGISEPELSEKPCFGEDSANGSPTHGTK